MRDKEYCFWIFILGAIIGMCIIVLMDSYFLIKPKPCPILNERAIILKHEKYEMFLEKMQGVNDKINSLVDSLNKYRVK